MPAVEAEAAERNLLAALSIWASAGEGGAVDWRDGCMFVRSAVPSRAFNQVILPGGAADLGAVVSQTREYFRHVEGRFRLRVRDDLPPLDDKDFFSWGLERQGGIPCLSLALPADVTHAASLEIRSVTDEATLIDHVGVVSSAFDWRPEELSRVFRPALLESAAWRAFVGYLDGEAVSTAQLIIDSDVGGLYYVATVEHARRRGIGEALTRHAVEVAAGLGCSLATLQASPMGRPIYERMGFKTVSYYRTFVSSQT
jgi:GNAT superfamily N-acetyltransferase